MMHCQNVPLTLSLKKNLNESFTRDEMNWHVIPVAILHIILCNCLAKSLSEMLESSPSQGALPQPHQGLGSRWRQNPRPPYYEF